MQKKSLFGRFLLWRARHISDKYFVFILAALIGFTAGLAAYVLKTSVYWIKHTLTGGFAATGQNFWYFIFPLIGIFLTLIFIRFIIRDKVGHGIPRILYVISRNKGVMKRHKLFSSLFGASLTAGFGGSIGLESPIISTGSAMGSWLSRIFRQNFKTTSLLLGCGAAGAIASIFNTPIAAVIFGLEVLMLDLATSSIIPLLIASVSGAITTKLLFSEQILIDFEVTEKLQAAHIPFYILFGIFCGLLSFYFNRMHEWIRSRMERTENVFLRSFTGLILLGFLIFLFPPLYGEGYDAIKMIMSGNSEDLLNNSVFYHFSENTLIFSLFILLLLLFKVVATSLTLESGGIGGIFAPAAVSGGLGGFLFARLLNFSGLNMRFSEANFTLVGMAGVLGGVLHAPLTAIFLVLEITHGYELIVPLMIVTTISFMTTKIFDPHSIFTRRLAQRGDLLTHHKDQAVLTLLNVKRVIDKDLSTVDPGATLGDLVKVIAKSKRNIFPLVDSENNFHGMVLLDDVREDMFISELYERPVSDYLIVLKDIEKISSRESMETVMEKFNKTGHYNLPVIDNGKYVGFVSRANIFSAYRKLLIDVTHE